MCSIVNCFLARPMSDVLVLICLIFVGVGVGPLLAQEKPDLPETEEERESLSGREVRVLRRQMADRESDAEAAFRNAETAFLTGEYDHAVEEFLSVAQEYDDTSYVMRAIVRAADVYYRQERYGRAVSYYQRALRVKSEPWWPEDTEEEYVRADYMIGVCYFEQEELNRAFTHFRRFVREYPNSELVDRAYDFIGRGNMRMERYGQAIEAFEMVGTARLKRQERSTVTPGEELYVRVVDEDMAMAKPGEDLEARVSTEFGDEERLSLQGLGRGSPIFLGTISVRLGPPRHTIELEKAFDSSVRSQLSRNLDKSEALEEEADKLSEDEELQELRQNIRDQKRVIRRLQEEETEDDNERLEKRRERLEKLEKRVEKKDREIQRVQEAADQQEQEAYETFDAAVTEIEKVLERWGVERIDEEDVEEVDVSEDTEEGDLSEVFTPDQIDGVRMEIQESSTDAENFDFRMAVIEYWYEQLLYEYKTLDVRGDDLIRIEYIDPHGEEGEELAKSDELGIASDASLDIVGPDYERSASAVIIGDRVRIRVDDPDMSRSEGKDSVEVAVASVGFQEDESDEDQEEEEEEGQKDDDRRATVIDPFAEEEEEEEPELIPEGADHVTVELVEDEPYSGTFIGSFPTGTENDDGPEGELDISPDRQLRIAYKDKYTSSHDEGWTVVRKVDLVESTEGELESIELREGSLDRRSQLDKAVAKGKLAEMYMELGLQQEADEAFEEAIKIASELVQREGRSPLGEEATFQMWDLYFKSGRDKAAARAANRLIEAFPESPLADDALLIMGKAAEEPGEAQSHFSRLVKQYPDSPLAAEAQFLLAENSRESDSGFSVSAYEKVVNDYPASTYAAKSLLRLSEYYLNAKDYKRAVEYTDRIMFDFPDFEDLDQATFIRGVCAYRLGNVQKSYKLMHEVIEKYPGTSAARKAADIVEVLAEKIGE